MCGLKPHNRNKKIKERKTEEKKCYTQTLCENDGESC